MISKMLHKPGVGALRFRIKSLLLRALLRLGSGELAVPMTTALSDL